MAIDPFPVSWHKLLLYGRSTMVGHYPDLELSPLFEWLYPVVHFIVVLDQQPIDLVECKPRNKDTGRIKRRRRRNSNDYLKYDSCVYVCRYVCVREKERESVSMRRVTILKQSRRLALSVCVSLCLLLLLYSHLTFTNNNWLSWQPHVNQCHHHHW